MRSRLLLISLILLALLLPILTARGQVEYEVNLEKVTLDLQRSGIIYLRYDLTLTVKSGVVARYVSIGMPSPSFSSLKAEEIFPNGRIVDVKVEEVKEDSYSAVRVRPSEPIDAGESRTYVVEVELRDFVYEDDANPGNAGLIFIPSWFGAPVKLLQVFVILPPGVTESEVRNQPDYDNLQKLDDGRLYLYWERRDLPSNYRFEIGISFPRRYVERVVTTSRIAPAEGLPDYVSFIIGLTFLAAVILSILAVVRMIKSWMGKLPYQAPEILAESLGPNRNMAPAEVAYLRRLEGRKLSYGRILAVIVSGLVNKGFLAVESLNPLKLKRLEGSDEPLRIYERKFLDCIEDGSLNQDCLVKVIELLHRRTERELSHYSRRETLSYYDGKVESLWKKVVEVPAEEKLIVIKENLPWLLTDPEFEIKLRRALRVKREDREKGIRVAPPLDDTWIWWPRDAGTVVIIPEPRRTPVPSGTPKTPGQDVPVIPDIERAADAIARSVEEVSSNIAKNAEEFADKVSRAILPSGARSRSRARSMSCACVSCACACACVSCACACAGGGAR